MVAHSGLNRGAKLGIPFKKTMLALSVMAVANSANAQTPAPSDENIEEVVTTGIRQNIINAQQIKRNADTFVDAISAEDIGSLPDASVLEALQRVPGISIERFAAPDDSDHFSSEGSNITLRGLPQTRTSFNGRDSFSANSGRGLSFEDISKDLLGSVEVVKNQTADMIEGGISGTVTLNTRKPFDSDGRQLAFSAQANYNDLRDEWTPEYSGLYSDVFEVGDGELGFLVSFSESRLKFRSDGTELGKHSLVDRADGDGNVTQVYAPLNAGIRSTNTDRFRRGLATALQYRTADSRLEATLEYTRSESSSVWTEFAFFSDDNGGNTFTNASFRNDVFVDGFISNGGGAGVANGFGPQTRESDTEELVEDLALNIKFQATDRLSLSLDLQHIEATNDVEDLSIFGGLERGVQIYANRNGGNPNVEFYAPSGSGQTDEEYFTDPTNYFFRAAMDHLEESEATSDAFQFDLEYEIDSGVFRSVEAGVRFAERDQTTRWSTFNWKNLSESWNGGQVDFLGNQYFNDANNDGDPDFAFDADGNQRFDENGDPIFEGGTTATGVLNLDDSGNVINPLVGTPRAFAQSIDNFHRGGNTQDFTGLYINPSVVQSFENFVAGTTSPAFPNRSGPPVNGREGVVDGSYLPGEVNPTVETNQALYVKLNFGGGGTNRFSGNVGLRYVDQSTTTSGNITYPQQDLVSNAEFAATIPAEALPVFNRADEDVVTFESDFSTVLPSLNLKYEINDDLIARFAFSQAVSFPSLGDLRFNYNINAIIDNGDTFGGFTQISGNPNLKPMEADNYDLSLEWYFDNDSSLTAGVFYKDITNFFATGTNIIPVEGLPAGSEPVFVSAQQPVNIGEASMKGFELGYSHFFKNLPEVLDGLGVQFNFTRILENGVPNQNTRPVEFSSQADNAVARVTEPFEGLPLQGLSNTTYNIVGMYETEVISARLAYNYRSDYLLSIANVNLRQPVFAEATGTLDGSIFYSVNDSVKVGLTGANLTNTRTQSRLQVDQEGTQVVRNSFINDRRYSLVLRVSL